MGENFNLRNVLPKNDWKNFLENPEVPVKFLILKPETSFLIPGTKSRTKKVYGI